MDTLAFPFAAASCRVHKFGGSSLADAPSIRHVADLLLADPTPTQVVVSSAMLGTTDALVALGAARLGGTRLIDNIEF